MKKRFINLSWEILEHKCRYYEGVGGHPIADAEYDLLEAEYIKLAADLGLEPTASNMVGFDESRPSCKIVKYKLSGRLK